MVWNHGVREELTFSHDCCCVLSHFSATLQLRRTRLLCHSSPSSQLFVALLSCSRTDWGRRAWLGPPPVQSACLFPANAGRTQWNLEAVKTNEWLNTFWHNLISHQPNKKSSKNKIRMRQNILPHQPTVTVNKSRLWHYISKVIPEVPKLLSGKFLQAVASSPAVTQ